MKTKTFIRVQDANGTGIFRSKKALGCPIIRALHRKHFDFPNFYADTLLRANAKKIGIDHDELTYSGTFTYRFAFPNIEQFEKWVTKEEVKALRKAGFRVYKIECDNYAVSKHQALININNCKTVVDITDIFKA